MKRKELEKKERAFVTFKVAESFVRYLCVCVLGREVEAENAVKIAKVKTVRN
jgi:hypothetical protein